MVSGTSINKSITNRGLFGATQNLVNTDDLLFATNANDLTTTNAVYLSASNLLGNG